MKAVKYPKVNELPKGAIKISSYAQQIGQANPSFIHLWMKVFYNQPIYKTT